MEAFRLERRRHRADAPWTYPLLDARQREIAANVRENRASGALLLSEVAPVITVGKRAPATDLLLPRPTLEARGVALVEVDRGGLATYHGPGQWVLFAVDRLDRLTGDPHGVRRAVDGLLGIARDVAASFGVDAKVRAGAEQGVWGARGKLAAVGVRVQDRVLLHGLSFNVFRTPESFLGLRPCGLDLPLAFLEETGVPASTREALFESCGDRLAEAARTRFWRGANGAL